MAGVKESGGLEQLTRRHGIKVPVGVDCSVEECSLAVGQIVGCESIRSASRMNHAMVLFLDSIDKVNKVVEQGIVVKDAHTMVFPLINPARKVMLSNVPPFIKDDVIERELLRYGQIVSAIKKIPVGCKSPLLKHVVSFKRQVFMVLKQGHEELNLSFKFTIDGFDYVIFVTTETMKCFNCNKEGHLYRFCPEKEKEKETNTIQTQNNNASVAEINVNENEQDESEVAINAAQPNATETKNDIRETTVGTKDADVVLEQELMEITEPNLELLNTKRKAIKSAHNEKNPKKSHIKEQIEIKDMTNAGACSEMEYSSESDSEKEISTQTMLKLREEEKYDLDKFRRFLQVTKGKRNVVVEDFFPNLANFIESARDVMKIVGGDGLVETEIYRLRKLVQKTKAQMKKDDLEGSQ